MNFSKKVIASLLITTSITSPLAVLAADTVSTFKDLDQASDWSKDSIRQAELLKLFSGDIHGNFRPQGRITREEMAKVIVNLLNLPLTEEHNSGFKDVPSTAWSAPYIEAVQKNGIMLGTGNGRFNPKQFLTREQLAILIVKTLDLPLEENTESLNRFEDADRVHDWASRYVASAIKSGLMVGSGKQFSPTVQTQRQEAAMIAVRTYKIKEAQLSTPVPTAVPPTVAAPVPSTIPTPTPTPLPSSTSSPIQTPGPSPVLTPVRENSPPVATHLNIIGKLKVGETLSGDYQFQDADHDQEQGTFFKWYRVELDGSRTQVGTGFTYTLVAEDAHKGISFEVTPVDSAGKAGLPYAVTSSLTVTPTMPINHAPTAASVTVTGSFEVGKKVNGSYVFHDADLDAEQGTAYTWYREESDGSKAEINGATDTAYTLTAEDNGKKVIFEVTPKDSSGITGEVVSSTSFAVTDPSPSFTNAVPTIAEAEKQLYSPVSLTPNSEDGDLQSVALYRNRDEGLSYGQWPAYEYEYPVENYTLGQEITDEGSYRLTITDYAGQTTSTYFTIDKKQPLLRNVYSQPNASYEFGSYISLGFDYGLGHDTSSVVKLSADSDQTMRVLEAALKEVNPNYTFGEGSTINISGYLSSYSDEFGTGVRITLGSNPSIPAEGVTIAIDPFTITGPSGVPVGPIDPIIGKFVFSIPILYP